MTKRASLKTSPLPKFLFRRALPLALCFILPPVPRCSGAEAAVSEAAGAIDAFSARMAFIRAPLFQSGAQLHLFGTSRQNRYQIGLARFILGNPSRFANLIRFARKANPDLGRNKFADDLASAGLETAERYINRGIFDKTAVILSETRQMDTDEDVLRLLERDPSMVSDAFVKSLPYIQGELEEKRKAASHLLDWVAANVEDPQTRASMNKGILEAVWGLRYSQPFLGPAGLEDLERLQDKAAAEEKKTAYAIARSRIENETAALLEAMRRAAAAGDENERASLYDGVRDKVTGLLVSPELEGLYSADELRQFQDIYTQAGEELQKQAGRPAALPAKTDLKPGAASRQYAQEGAMLPAVRGSDAHAIRYMLSHGDGSPDAYHFFQRLPESVENHLEVISRNSGSPRTTAFETVRILLSGALGRALLEMRAPKKQGEEPSFEGRFLSILEKDESLVDEAVHLKNAFFDHSLSGRMPLSRPYVESVRAVLVELLRTDHRTQEEPMEASFADAFYQWAAQAFGRMPYRVSAVHALSQVSIQSIHKLIAIYMPESSSPDNFYDLFNHMRSDELIGLFERNGISWDDGRNAFRRILGEALARADQTRQERLKAVPPGAEINGNKLFWEAVAHFLETDEELFYYNAVRFDSPLSAPFFILENERSRVSMALIRETRKMLASAVREAKLGENPSAQKGPASGNPGTP